MTPTQEFAQMMEIVQARYEQQQRRFAALIAQEHKLRAELARLDEMQRAANAPEADLNQMRALGADVIWQAWVGRNKTALNMQLARILAQKEPLQATVRHAYGKVLAVSEMKEVMQKEAARTIAKKSLENAITQTFLN